MSVSLINFTHLGQIVPGSPAARCAQLKVGDYIIAVNGIDILKMDHGQIVHLIKDSGYTVTLTVGHHEGKFCKNVNVF